MSVPTWLIDRVVVDDDGCWLYQAKHVVRGYPVVHAKKGIKKVSHRYVYEKMIGAIPEGLVLGHVCHDQDLSCPGGLSCKHRKCCNPGHLTPMTLSENNRVRVGSRLRNDGKCVHGHPVETGATCNECARLQAAIRLESNRDEINSKRRARWALNAEEINRARREKRASNRGDD